MWFVAVCIAYFVLVAGMLRLFTSWDAKSLVGRTALMSVLCNAPLLYGGWLGIVGYAVVAVVAIRTLHSSFDLPVLIGFFATAAGAIASFVVPFALR